MMIIIDLVLKQWDREGW